MAGDEHAVTFPGYSLASSSMGAWAMSKARIRSFGDIFTAMFLHIGRPMSPRPMKPKVLWFSAAGMVVVG